jgi:nucleoside-triphosphatase
MGRVLLLTGRPGVGKTTVIKKVARALGSEAGGFYTEEIRDSRRQRVGFRLVTLGGEEAVMAHVDLRDGGRPQVSRYGVDIEAIDQVGVRALRDAMDASKVIIVDEIGKMELFSQAFRDAVRAGVEREGTLVGTVMQGSHPWVDDLKARDNVSIWEVTKENRENLPNEIAAWKMR